MTDMMSRIAGAPITWGVDGSPGWGHLMDADRVLGEMAELGLRATELGPDGYLPTDPAELKAKLDHYGLELVGGFVPAVLHIPERAEGDLVYVAPCLDRRWPGAEQASWCSAPARVSTATTHQSRCRRREWSIFLDNLKHVIGIAADEGLTVALHQHWGMAIETPRHPWSGLIAQSEVEFCLDTGHLYLGGADPVAIAKAAVGRVAHVHLKDVDEAWPNRSAAASCHSDSRSLTVSSSRSVMAQSTSPVLSRTLEEAGFDGWYVLEQDKVLEADPLPGEGPIEDAKREF